MTSALNIVQSQKILNNIVEIAYHAVSIDFHVFKLKARFAKASDYPEVSLELLKDGSRLDASGVGGDFADLELIRSLRELMKDENGKSWTSFVLTYENGGEANIKYDYNPLPEE
jgi:hypothetical protein